MTEFTEGKTGEEESWRMAGKKVRVHLKKSSEVHVRFPFLFMRTLTDYKGGSGVVSIACLFGFSKSTRVD